MEFIGPDSYLPGAASILEQLDKKILIVLNDGRHLVGILRSFDHFSVTIKWVLLLDIIYEMSLIIDKFQNIVLEQTCERIISGGKIYYL